MTINFGHICSFFSLMLVLKSSFALPVALSSPGESINVNFTVYHFELCFIIVKWIFHVQLQMSAVCTCACVLISIYISRIYAQCFRLCFSFSVTFLKPWTFPLGTLDIYHTLCILDLIDRHSELLLGLTIIDEDMMNVLANILLCVSFDNNYT